MNNFNARSGSWLCRNASPATSFVFVVTAPAGKSTIRRFVAQMRVHRWEMALWGLLKRLGGGKRRVLCPHGLDQGSDTDDVHDPRQIVGEHAQGHLAADILQVFHQEVG